MSSRLNHIQNWSELAQQAKWSATGLAKKCGVSLRTLERHFLMTVGKSPKVWLVERRSERARELLMGGGTVKETASNLGYKHPSHLTNTFKKYWGYCPPKCHRSANELSAKSCSRRYWRVFTGDNDGTTKVGSLNCPPQMKFWRTIFSNPQNVWCNTKFFTSECIISRTVLSGNQKIRGEAISLDYDRHFCHDIRLVSPVDILYWLIFLCLLPNAGFASLPPGSYSLSGEITEVHYSGKRGQFTNTLSFTGHYDNQRFLLDVTPINTQLEMAENAGYDGSILRIIRRFPTRPGRGLARDQSVGFVEPGIFARYATHDLAAVLLAFANSNDWSQLVAGKESVILGSQRKYPEEDNTYKVTYLPRGNIEVEAICPGEEIGPQGASPIKGLESGFIRWRFRTSTPQAMETNASGFIEADYDRFSVQEGQPAPNYAIQARINFRPEASVPGNWRPKITEAQLKVVDYSCRGMLFPYSKGLVDQNFPYTLTNHEWDFDQSVIVASFEGRKELFEGRVAAKISPTVKMLDQPHVVPPMKGHRLLILAVLVGISALFAVVLLSSRQRHSPGS